MTMHNPSRVPVAFRWQLPRRLEGVVGVAPLQGLLRGNESTQVGVGVEGVVGVAFCWVGGCDGVREAGSRRV